MRVIVSVHHLHRYIHVRASCHDMTLYQYRGMYNDIMSMHGIVSRL